MVSSHSPILEQRKDTWFGSAVGHGRVVTLLGKLVVTALFKVVCRRLGFVHIAPRW